MKYRRFRFFLFSLLTLALLFWIFFPWTFQKWWASWQWRSHLPHILLITMDTTTYNQLSCYGNEAIQTPNIDRLAQEGVLFENCFTPVALTQPTHSSLFTGTYPLYHGVRYNLLFQLPQHYKTLAEILKEQGYETAAIVGSYVLEKRFQLDQGFDSYDDQFQEAPALEKLSLSTSSLTELFPQSLDSIERSAAEVFERASRFLEKPHPSPFFLWTHFFDAHTPYLGHAGFSAPHPYQQEILYVDHFIGKLYEFLKKKDLLENTMIVFLTDHGEGLGIKGEQEHGFFAYDQTLHTALIYRFPRLFSPKRVSSLVTHVDFLPTLLELFQISAPKEIQGKSYLPLLWGYPLDSNELFCEATLPQFTHGWSLVEGVRNEDWKYLKAPEEELYHLPSDPYEQKNLAQTESLRLEAMRRRYEDLKQNLSNRSATLAQVALDAEHLEKMLSLGYFWGPQGSTKTAEEKKDPKGMIEVYKLIEWARILLRSPLNSERLMWVVAALEAVLMEDPENQWALFQLGRQLIRLGHFEEARRKFEAILRATPEKQEVYLELAHLELLRKDDMKAEQEIQFFLQQKQERFSQTTKEANFKEKLQHEQELAKAYLLLGEVFSRQKQNKQAQQAFQQFLRYWSGNTPLKKAVETKLQELSRHSSQE